MRAQTISKLNTKDYITITIAVLMLTVGIIISSSNNFEPELAVFILISFSFGLLSFLMIGKIEGKEISFLGIKISQVSGGFLIFIIILASFLGYKKITNISDRNILERKLGNSMTFGRPIDTSVWTGASGYFEWFNPPLTLTAGEHLELKLKWFKNKGFKLEILLIEDSTSDEDNAKYLVSKLINLKEFVTHLKDRYKENFDSSKRLEVRICLENHMPTQSFFTTKKWDNNIPRSIFYLPTDAENGVPSKCIISSSEEFYDILDKEFKDHWNNRKDTKRISLQKLLNTEITDSTRRKHLLYEK